MYLQDQQTAPTEQHPGGYTGTCLVQEFTYVFLPFHITYLVITQKLNTNDTQGLYCPPGWYNTIPRTIPELLQVVAYS